MKRILFFTAGIFVSLQLAAQIDPTVDVSRKFESRMQDVTKPAVNMSIADSLERFNVSFDYSIFNRQYKDLYEFNPYQAAQLKTIGVEKPSVFYARVGAQYPLLPSAEFYLQGGKNHGLHASLYGRHNSFWGNVPTFWEGSDKMNMNRMTNRVGGNACYAWSTGEFKFDINYNYDRYKYAFNEIGTIDDHKNGMLDLTANLNSAHTEENSVYYDVSLNFRNSSKKLELTKPEQTDPSLSEMGENFFKFNGFVGASFDIHRVYIDMNLEFSSYSKTRDFTAGVVEISPIYELRNSWLNARLGIKFGNYYKLKGDVIDKDMENSNATNFFPEVDARFCLAKNVFWIHAIANGGNDLNSYVKMLDMCPVLDPSTPLVLGTRPINTKLAFELLAFGKLNINLFGAYTMFRDRVIFTPTEVRNAGYQILATYKDMNLLGGGAELYWESESVTAGASGKYNVYKDSDKNIVTEMPKIEATGYFRYNFRERVIAEVNCGYKSATSGFFYGSETLYEVPELLDLSFNLNVKLNKHFSVYGKVGNILDKKNQFIPLYVEPGRNFGGGICVNF